MPCSDKDIRIVDGDSQSYGRVEVCILGVWGTVCNDMFWDNVDAGVVCKELGFFQYGMSILSCLHYNSKYSITIQAICWEKGL